MAKKPEPSPEESARNEELKAIAFRYMRIRRIRNRKGKWVYRHRVKIDCQSFDVGLYEWETLEEAKWYSRQWAIAISTLLVLEAARRLRMAEQAGGIVQVKA